MAGVVDWTRFDADSLRHSAGATRASMPMARPVARHNERLKAMPVVMGKAKLVVETSCAPWLPDATPWEMDLLG